ncbi:DMT family transporter [Flavihumibacter stibioxidans]|uniref:EamA domain-containing protein n=1 Tax=Flavihumibacter stibioxidans TaxID=1834163 RepID=A0ABR7M4D7_9BACT|nr:EamA family transporter [Flavihumibacter stibioxidans]MBC6489488.1 hypothetical protein [Flavihumibacter stibioxidans]
MNGRFVITGLLFAFLWASAATATKIGLQSAQPFTLALVRFMIAGGLMIFISNIILQNRLPRKQEWKGIAIYGLLNVTIYLGLYVLAMQSTSAGIASLAIAINPVLISLMASVLFKYRFTPVSVISLLLCSAGVLIAAWPLLKNSYATPLGLTILLISMVAYSGGAIYYTRQHWHELDVLTINGWQTMLGGLFLLPVAWWFYQPEKNLFDPRFWGGTLWLAIPVSIGAVQAWMVLLKQNPVAAAYWLYLCPVFGFIIASMVLHEPVGLYTVVGVTLVISGLYLVQRLASAKPEKQDQVKDING